MEGFYTQPTLLEPLHHACPKNLWGALPPTVSLIFFLAGSSLAGSEGPVSMAIWASCLVGDDSGDGPTSSNILTSSLLSISAWCLGLHLHFCPWAWAQVLTLQPHPLGSPLSSPCWNGKATNQRSWQAFLEDMCHFSALDKSQKLQILN